MDFRFTEEQEMIAQTLESALRDLCSASHLRKMIDAGRSRDARRWRALAELGLCGVLVPEEAGGLGLSEVEFARIAEASGAALLPEPLVESSGIALPLLADVSGSVPELRETVAALAAGEGHAVLFHPAMPFAGHADTARLVVLADEAGHLHLGTPGAMNLVAQPAADPLLPLFAAEVGKEAAVLPRTGEVRRAVERAVDRGALFAAAQMTGVARAVLDLAVAYAGEREQFGRPIGANQAVKHLLAEVRVAIEFLRPVVYAAAALLPNGDARARAHVSHARLRAAETVQLAAECAVQVHGALGYSWEADVHLFLKRGLVLAQAWGRKDDHLDRIAAHAFADGALGPGTLFGAPV